MLTLVKNGFLYCPDEKGPADLLICAGKILYIGKTDTSLSLPWEINVIDASDLIVVPGFIDQHVHIAGGGGEAGPVSRTPEISLSRLTTAGITTVVGLLGVDGITRSVAGLLAKARALEQEGISAYIFSGAYEVPTRTLTGSIRGDLVLIDKVIGCGEIAISDHRSAQPTMETLAGLGAESRIGGMLGGKAGIVHLHVGEGKSGLRLLFDIVNNTDLPITQFVPTHVNRLDRLFCQAVDYVRKGGYIDLTAGISPKADGPRALDVPQAVKRLLDAGVDLGKVTVSSDGNGSMPRFDNNGDLVSIGVGSVKVLWDDIRELVRQKLLPLNKAVALITSNVAEQLKLVHKGTLKPGNDADLVLLDRELNIDTVIARGKVLVHHAKVITKGNFEGDSL